MAFDDELDTITAAAEAARSGQVTPTELVERTLERVATRGAALNCHITVAGELALARARELEKLTTAERQSLPLYGVPLSVKDCLATSFMATSVGSPVFKHHTPPETARAVDRLLGAGCVVYAKDNMYDFQYCGPNPEFGDAVNPWSEQHTTGGSSSGSAAAVAGNVSYGALGTDGGGSIRIPSAYCGVVGLKPTYGAVSGAGELPCQGSLSCVGPICRSASDAAMVFEAIRQRSAEPWRIDTGVKGMRIAVPSDLGDCEPEVLALFEQACELLRREGATLHTVQNVPFQEARAAMWLITGVEYAEATRPILRHQGEKMHPLTRALLERAELIPATEYVHAQRVRRALCRELAALYARADVMLLPAVPSAAYLRPRTLLTPEDIADHPVNLSTLYTALFNITGQPAVTVPCGMTKTGLPVGLEIAGKPFDEAAILRVAYAYERTGGGFAVRQSRAQL